MATIRSSAAVLRLHRLLAAHVCRKRASRTRPAPIISFTFDDFPSSAVRAGGRILQESGLRGTYYAALGLMAKTTLVGRMFDRPDLDAVASEGHELACHTFDHPLCCDLTSAEFLANCEANRTRAVEILNGYVLRNFSFPEGVVTWSAKAALTSCYETCRTIEPGINVDPIDIGYLRANAVYSSIGLRRPKSLIDQNRLQNGWLILYTHDVSAAPSPYGCTPDEFLEIVRFAVDSGAEIVPVAEAFAKFNVHV
jgi:peptidoglycan/xylan/chitin deacetylase (PgdA/CDA1 family)